MEPDLEKFKQAVLQGGQNLGPGISITGSNPLLSAIEGLGNFDIGNDRTNTMGGSLGNAATAAGNIRDDNEAKARAEAERKRKEEEAKKDPKNYQKIINDKGGYDFFDAEGNQISAAEFARARNEHISDVLGDSEDPYDQSFSNDYNTIMRLGKVMQSGDKKGYDKLLKEQPDLQDQIKGKTFSQIFNEFKSEYKNYYTYNNTAQDIAPTAASQQTSGNVGLTNFLDTILRRKRPNVVSWR